MQTYVRPLGLAAEGFSLATPAFKTTRVAVNAYLPLEKESAPAFYLLSLLLSDGCAAYPTPLELTGRLETLYGASLTVDAVKSGDRLILAAGIVFADDRFLPETIAREAAGLLREVLFRPALEEGVFKETDFRREQRMHKEYILGKLNDKRHYAREKCTALLCEGEPFGLSETGTPEQAEALTPEAVTAAWRRMLEEAYFRVSVLSPAPCEGVLDDFAAELAAIDRGRAKPPAPETTSLGRKEVRRVDERLPIAQGKLCLGFRVGMTGGDAATAPVMVFADLLGGGPYSRLFLNVREKESLCYYCVASAVRRKGVLMVDSGVEFANMEKTEAAVLRELKAMQAGAFTDEDLATSKRALSGLLRAVTDSQAVTDRWYAERWFESPRLSPAEMVERIQSVTREDVLAAANSVRLDVVYRLLGKEEAE